MKLHHVIEKYILMKQSMGMRFCTEASILRGFSRTMGSRDMADIDPDAVSICLRSRRHPRVICYRKARVLVRFYRFAIARGYADCSPLPPTIPKPRNNFVPYIYTVEELRRLLAASEILDRQRGRMETITFRTLLTTLYGTGLRISEALSLTFADVNLQEALLIIRESKFFKTRWVPVGPRLRELLTTYAEKRRRWPCPLGKEDSAFFAARDGTFIGRRSCAEYVFRQICNRAGVRRSDGAAFQPRLHDIRHTTAVHRLVDWYRQGGDVQRLLPSLATYLGHRGIDSLQWYLTMTPELLNEANTRFERYALKEVRHV